MKRAAVIGSGWGQVHVHALRACGVDVVALVGREQEATETVARALGVPRVLTDIAALATLDLDLATLATPPATHAPLAAQLPPHLPLLCEKPLGTADASAFPPRCTVNYAFAFLPQAQALAAAVQGRVKRVRVSTVHDLGRDFAAADALLELASHPWSFSIALLGAPQLQRCHADASQVELQLLQGGLPVSVQARHQPGLQGLRHRVEIDTADGACLGFAGSFRLGQAWRFEPLGEATDPPTGDPWMAANQAAIAAQIAWLLSHEASPGPWLFTPARASALDACVDQALGAG